MSTLLAVEFGREHAKFIKARSSAKEGVEFLDVREIALSDLEYDIVEEDLESASPSGIATADLSGDSEVDPSIQQRLRSLREFTHSEDIDATFAVVRTQSVITESLALPFQDQKRIDLTAALQLEDLLPFDIGGFVVDSMVVGKKEDGEYDILSALCPREDVQELIRKLAKLGVQPRSITTRSSALALLPHLAPDRFPPVAAILGFHEEGCSLAIIHDGKVVHLRECAVLNGTPNYRSVLRDVRSSMERVAADQGLAIERVSAIGVAEEALPALRESLGVEVELVDLHSLCGIRAECQGAAPGDLSWACGVFSGFERNERFLDFRKGDLAYRATLKQVLASIADEAIYIGWAVVLGLFWWGADIYASRSTLSRIERAISASVQQAMPGATLTPGRERSELEAKVSELEDQLRAMGTLSSLSPLGSLKELSDAVSSGIDMSIDTLNIGHSRMTLTGSLPDNQAIGRLSGVLEKRADRFCEVKLDPKGKVPGSARVRFVADLKLCE